VRKRSTSTAAIETVRTSQPNAPRTTFFHKLFGAH
jgi:hypothetical protein